MKFLFIPFLVLISSQTYSQYYQLMKLCRFPIEIQETSGIEIDSTGAKWTHNDSGNLPFLYKTNDTCGILRKVWLMDTDQTDIEDIAIGQNGKVYIGDMGNNTNDRKNLQIYETHIDSLNYRDSISVRKIKFSYPDQFAFPPLMENQNFDCEAFFSYQNALYLFSKNRGASKFSKCYVLNPVLDSQVIVLKDSFSFNRWITSADISPNGKVVALISEFYLTLFYDFIGDDFFGGKYTTITTSLSQKEAVVFANDTTLFFTDEKGILDGGYMYQMYIPNFGQIKTPTKINNISAILSYPYSLRYIDALGRILMHKVIHSIEDIPMEIPINAFIIEEESEDERSVRRVDLRFIAH